MVRLSMFCMLKNVDRWSRWIFPSPLIHSVHSFTCSSFRSAINWYFRYGKAPIAYWKLSVRYDFHHSCLETHITRLALKIISHFLAQNALDQLSIRPYQTIEIFFLLADTTRHEPLINQDVCDLRSSSKCRSWPNYVCTGMRNFTWIINY